MATALDKIIDYKRDEVRDLKQRVSFADFAESIAAVSPPRGFRCALNRLADQGKNALICELKRKSPSAGTIAEGVAPADIAQQYETGGAACLSVLTDGPSFGGSEEDFTAIRNSVALPMLRKDFMIDPFQIYESRAMGADAILVILSAVDDILAQELISTALEMNMDCLIETHDEAELARALVLKQPLIGINNRNLKEMKTDLATTERLAPTLPKPNEFISESGISTPKDIIRLRKTGAQRFLIGESLMKRTDRTEQVERLVNASND